jgi:hypothetical protein
MLQVPTPHVNWALRSKEHHPKAIMAKTNSKSDAFRKGMMARMPTSLVQDGPGFHTRKIVLGEHDALNRESGAHGRHHI